jgi:hypothetical protein
MRPRSRTSGLLVQQVGDQLVAYDQVRQRLHVLDRATTAAWKHCDGLNTEADIARLVGRDLGTPADEQLTALALEQLDEAHLLEERIASAPRSDGVSRREVLHWAAAAAAGVFLPTITSCGAPLGPDIAPTAPGASRLTLTVETTTTTPFSTTTTTPFSTTTSTTTPFSTTTTTPFSTTTTTPFSTTTSSTTPFPSTTTSTTTPFSTTTTSTTPPPTTTTTTTVAPSRKVQICHKGKSIMVDENAVASHLSRGDTLGPCP